MKTLEINDPKGISIKINMDGKDGIDEYIDAVRDLLIGITFSRELVERELGYTEDYEDGFKRRVLRIGKFELWKYK